MYTIGEFSRITGMSVKTLRFYHEQGVLEPSSIDSSTGYRYYAADKVELARVIQRLRDLEFTLKEIVEITSLAEDDGDLLEILEGKRRDIGVRLERIATVQRALDEIIAAEKEARRLMTESDFEIEEKTIQPVTVAGLRMKGRYGDCGKGFSTIGRKFGRHISGKALMLIYDEGYKEEDADFEVCMPVKRGESKDGIEVRDLPGGRCVSLLHKGPYETISRSYERVVAYGKEKGLTFTRPCREVYIKGPGMIFKGNPRKYLTEIQMFVEA